MEYIDGFVAPVPDANRDLYLRHARDAIAVFKDHGATRVVECWGDDVPDGEVTSFPVAVKLKEGESVVFSWIFWPSKEARDAGMQKVMSDPRMQAGASSFPFDGKRLIYGGFRVVLDE